jgi:hypothetical protein
LNMIPPIFGAGLSEHGIPGEGVRKSPEREQRYYDALA